MANFVKEFYKKPLEKRMAEQHFSTVTRWLTSEDDEVCLICGPADHKLRDVPINDVAGGWDNQSWGERFPDGPPAHKGCRCKTVVERASK